MTDDAAAASCSWARHAWCECTISPSSLLTLMPLLRAEKGLPDGTRCLSHSSKFNAPTLPIYSSTAVWHDVKTIGMYHTNRRLHNTPVGGRLAWGWTQLCAVLTQCYQTPRSASCQAYCSSMRPPGCLLQNKAPGQGWMRQQRCCESKVRVGLHGPRQILGRQAGACRITCTWHGNSLWDAWTEGRQTLWTACLCTAYCQHQSAWCRTWRRQAQRPHIQAFVRPLEHPLAEAVKEGHHGSPGPPLWRITSMQERTVGHSTLRHKHY